MVLIHRPPAGDGQNRGPVIGVAVAAVALLVIGLYIGTARKAAPPATPSPAASARPAPSPPAVAKAPAAEAPAPEPARRPRPAKPAAAPPTADAPAEAAGPILRVNADVAGAFVFVDRKFLGQAPLETRDVTPGPHRLNVSAEGYDGVSQSIDIPESGPVDVSVRLKEVRLDESIDVVHRHGVGSCEGRLVATTAGLRFHPAKGDDGFSLPFAVLDTFDVDYLKKNLRLKQRGGKTWNFTVKGENADPLVVFQQNVDRARKKLGA